MIQNSWNNQVSSATVTFAGGAFDVGTDASSYPISIGTGNATKNITIGNTTGSSAVNLISGSGNMSFSTIGGSIDLKTGTSAINIGTDEAAKTITIGNTTGATNVVLKAGSGASSFNTTDAPFSILTGTGAINIGTDAAAKTITFGLNASEMETVLKMGTGNFSLVSASGTVIAATNTGLVTMPLQPAFFAYLSSDATNVTGAGSEYNVKFDQEYFDQGGNFSTGTPGYFTAPVTGIYRFTTCITTYGFEDGENTALTLRFSYNFGNPYNNVVMVKPYSAATGTNGTLSLCGSILYNMNSSVTMRVSILGDGSSAGICVVGNAASTYFCGELVC